MKGPKILGVGEVRYCPKCGHDTLQYKIKSYYYPSFHTEIPIYDYRCLVCNNQIRRAENYKVIEGVSKCF